MKNTIDRKRLSPIVLFTLFLPQLCTASAPVETKGIHNHVMNYK